MGGVKVEGSQKTQVQGDVADLVVETKPQPTEGHEIISDANVKQFKVTLASLSIGNMAKEAAFRLAPRIFGVSEFVGGTGAAAVALELIPPIAAGVGLGYLAVESGAGHYMGLEQLGNYIGSSAYKLTH